MATTAPTSAGSGERIHKRLAEAGVGSRRTVEKWIREGRVKINGQLATLGQKVVAQDRVTVDGKPVRIHDKPQPIRVLLYKKRVGELVTRDDPEGRRTVFRKLPSLETGRWIAVGRLDINTSGLLLMTNNGELARRLTHPSFEVPRSYAVRVLGAVDDALLQRLRTGVELEDGLARCQRVVRGHEPGHSAGHGNTADGAATANHWLEITVHEGRNRLVRRLFESQGLQVSRLIRVAYGPIELGGGIRSGSARELDEAEIAGLLAAVDMPASTDTSPRSKSRIPEARSTAAKRPATNARRERPSRR